MLGGNTHAWSGTSRRVGSRRVSSSRYHFELQPGERRTETIVDAEAKREMRLRVLALDIELVRRREVRVVTVARAQGQQQVGTFGDRHAREEVMPKVPDELRDREFLGTLPDRVQAFRSLAAGVSPGGPSNRR